MGKTFNKKTKVLTKSQEIEKIAHSLMGFKDRQTSQKILSQQKQKMPYNIIVLFALYMGMRNKAVQKLNKETDEERKMGSRKRRLMEGIFINKELENKDIRKKKRERMRIRRCKDNGILTLPKKFKARSKSEYNIDTI